MKTVTKIEWCDYTCNAFWGCDKGCSYCQARSFAKRFGNRIGNARKYNPYMIERMANFKPVFLPDQLDMLDKIKKPSRIFMSFMGEPFSPEFTTSGMLDIAFAKIERHPEHTVIMLTKRPENLPKGFPDNCWIGISIDTRERAYRSYMYFQDINAKVKFVSIEPLLECPDYYLLQGIVSHADWVIVGQKTPVSKLTSPKIEWIKSIVDEADRNNTPVFLKNNLNILLRTPRLDYQIPTGLCTNYGHSLRQEFPVVK